MRALANSPVVRSGNRRHAIRVVIADDQAIFIAGLRRLLPEPDFVVVHEASDAGGALKAVREMRPDVLLLDTSVLATQSDDWWQALEHVPTRVVLLTAALDASTVSRARRIGARGVVLRNAAPRTLVDGLRRVADGHCVVGTEFRGDLAEPACEAAASAGFGLTARELDVVREIVSGATNREAASRLGVSPQTIKHHVASILAKTGVRTRLALTVLAVRKGLVRED